MPILQKRLGFIARTSYQAKRLALNLVQYYRLIVAATLILLIALEYSEFQFKISDFFHVGEVIVYFVLLGIVGLLIELVLRANRSQQSTLKILEYKHNFSLDLIPHQSWDSLAALLAKRLAEIVDAREAYLSILDPLTDEFEIIADWRDEDYPKSSLKISCQVCFDKNASNRVDVCACKFTTSQLALADYKSYCIPILYENSPYALIRFILKPGRVISNEQRQTLVNVSDEVVIALTAGQDRKRLLELELAEAALAERHTVSHYLHDNLGQNLGYLRMKLELFSSQPDLLMQGDDLRTQLKHLKEVVDQSYQIVRNKLEVSIPNSTPLLVNFLQEHTKKVAQRSKIEFKFTSAGVSMPVSVELQRALFYVFQEVLSNIEKHANASMVDVLLNWTADKLTITVTDNGVGFNVLEVARDKHFGLEIMRERIYAAGGTVEFESSKTSGTSINISAPLHAKKLKTS